MHLLGARVVAAYFNIEDCIHVYREEDLMDQIWTAVGQYAFPIVMCLVMAWYVKYTGDVHREDMKDIRDQHKAEMDDVTGALKNNTLAIQHLTDLIQRVKDGN